MFNPVHKIKKFVKNPDGSSYWYEDIIHGWLATGFKDKFNREIFEGDKVQYWVDYEPIIEIIKFDDGEFFLDDCEKSLNNFYSDELAVVGHITEDEK